MLNSQYVRVARIGLLWLPLALAACATGPSIPRTEPPPFDTAYPDQLALKEPTAQEVLIVVNDNIKMVHTGMFAGNLLLDPAGSYQGTRALDKRWTGTTLQDYLQFQLEDGPDVKVYRFRLPPQAFEQIETRLKIAGNTVPLFCAAKVQNIISGIGPFGSVPEAWLVHPSTVANYLDRIIAADRNSGTCEWPNGNSCYPTPRSGQGQ
jgi:hypothetical protein